MRIYLLNNLHRSRSRFLVKSVSRVPVGIKSCACLNLEVFMSSDTSVMEEKSWSQAESF